MTLVGPLVGGVLIAWVSVGFAFLVDASTFAFSAVMILSMRTRRTPRDAQAEQASFFGDVAEGFRYVRQQRWLLIAMVAATVSLLAVWGPWKTLVPIVVKNDLGGKSSSLGLVFGAGGVGEVHRGDGLAWKAPPLAEHGGRDHRADAAGSEHETE